MLGLNFKYCNYFSVKTTLSRAIKTFTVHKMYKMHCQKYSRERQVFERDNKEVCSKKGEKLNMASLAVWKLTGK